MEFLRKDQYRDIIKDGYTIGFSGMSGAGYPPELVKMIIESGAKNLTLVYIENNSLFDKINDDVTEIIKNGQCKKIICSHLGKLSLKENLHYVKDIEVEIYPMGLLAQKIQAGANGLCGVMINKDLAEIHRTKEYIEKNEMLNMVFEPAINCDIGCSLVEEIDNMGRCRFNRRSQYNSGDILRCSKIGIVEYEKIVAPDLLIDCDIESCWIDYAIKGNGQTLRRE